MLNFNNSWNWFAQVQIQQTINFNDKDSEGSDAKEAPHKASECVFALGESSEAVSSCITTELRQKVADGRWFLFHAASFAVCVRKSTSFLHASLVYQFSSRC